MTEVSEQKEVPLRAEHGKVYPIRLLHMPDDQLIIGFVLAVLDDVVLMVRPYWVDPQQDETGNIVSYTVTPYLDQLVHHDPETLEPVPFTRSNIYSINLPAAHLRKTYNANQGFRERLVHDEPIYGEGHYPSNSTKH